MGGVQGLQEAASVCYGFEVTSLVIASRPKFVPYPRYRSDYFQLLPLVHNVLTDNRAVAD